MSAIAGKMAGDLPVFDLFVTRRGRLWKWRVCTAKGEAIMRGVEDTRSAARYKADRALFLMLLCAPYRIAGGSDFRSISQKHPGKSGHRTARGYQS
jgi:hypothetical protein